MRPLNLIEKLVLNSSIGDPGNVDVGSTVVLKVDWVLASELSWTEIDKGTQNFSQSLLRRIGVDAFCRLHKDWTAEISTT